MKIDSLSTNPGPDIYYDQGFRNVLEDHMSYLKTHPETGIVEIDPNMAYRFEADLYGLLAVQHVPPYLHWVTMRMNDLTSPCDYAKNKLILLIPNEVVINHIRQSHMSGKRIS